MTTRDISTHLRDVYGVKASAEMISHMTDRILPVAKEWQNRPLERKYAIVFMDAVHFHVRENNRTVKKAVYVAIGVRLNGTREVLGMWIGRNGSAKYWLGVLNEIKNRGVEDILIVSVDGLTGFGDAIHAVFPRRRYSAASCIRSVIPQSSFPIRTLKSFMADLKPVYRADTLELAEKVLNELEATWENKYPASVASWRNNWPQLSAYFKYPPKNPGPESRHWTSCAYISGRGSSQRTSYEHRTGIIYPLHDAGSMLKMQSRAEQQKLPFSPLISS